MKLYNPMDENQYIVVHLTKEETMQMVMNKYGHTMDNYEDTCKKSSSK